MKYLFIALIFLSCESNIHQYEEEEYKFTPSDTTVFKPIVTLEMKDFEKIPNGRNGSAKIYVNNKTGTYISYISFHLDYQVHYFSEDSTKVETIQQRADITQEVSLPAHNTRYFMYYLGIRYPYKGYFTVDHIYFTEIECD